mgnify:CR=1 FL=1
MSPLLLLIHTTACWYTCACMEATHAAKLGLMVLGRPICNAHMRMTWHTSSEAVHGNRQHMKGAKEVHAGCSHATRHDAGSHAHNIC